MTCQKVLPQALLPGDRVRASFHLHLDPLPRRVGQARTFVLEHAPSLSTDTRDILALLTSELVTNAVLHARTPLEVGMTVTTRSVLVTVHDLNPGTASTPGTYSEPARPPATEGLREGGWGMGLVAALAAASAMEVHADGGKTAWFRLPRGLPEVDGDAAARVPADQQRA